MAVLKKLGLETVAAQTSLAGPSSNQDQAARDVHARNGAESRIKIDADFIHGAPGGAIPVADSRRNDLISFVVALMASLADHEAATVAQTTAGNAILRQCQFVMEDADLQTAFVPPFTPDETHATRKKLAEALGLVPADALTPPAAWHSPRAWGPTVVPREPPITLAQERRTSSYGYVYLSHMALGRRLDIAVAQRPAPPSDLQRAVARRLSEVPGGCRQRAARTWMRLRKPRPFNVAPFGAER